MKKTYSEKEIDYYRKQVENVCYTYPDNFSLMITRGKFKYLNEFIQWYTPLLNDSFYTMPTKCYWVIHGIKDWSNPLVCCPTCHKPLKHKNAKVIRGYIRCHCNSSCAQKDNNIISKIQNFKIKKYGSVCNREKGRITRLRSTYKKMISNEYETLLSPEQEYIKYGANPHHTYKFKCNSCGRTIYSNIRHFIVNGKRHFCRCIHCFPTIHTRSKGEDEVFKFCSTICKKLNFSIVANIRTLFKHNNKCVEFDIFIKERKLLIEYDGSYYHSEYHRENMLKTKNKRMLSKLEKTILGEIHGYRVIHVNEDDWKYKADRIKSILNELISCGHLNMNMTNDIEYLDREIYSMSDIPDNYEFIMYTNPKLIKRMRNYVLSCGEICCKRRFDKDLDVQIA